MGFRPSTPDSLPVLGEAPGRKGLYLAFGHGHFGMTGGPPSARLVARMIADEPLGIDPLCYSATRFGGLAHRAAQRLDLLSSTRRSQSSNRETGPELEDQ